MDSTHDSKKLLTEWFGYEDFRDGQQEAIDRLLSGANAAAIFPTGGGKSLCYQLPSLALPGITLVVSPLIALMKDQIDALAARGIAAARMDSSLTADEYQQVVRSLKAGDTKLLYVAPERLANERFRAFIRALPISLFAVDEAHCISEWGHNFRPDYLKLAEFANEFGAERVLALTATAPPKVVEDICREFNIRPEHVSRAEFYRSNLRLVTTATTAADRDQLLVSRLQERPAGATIVYVTLQKTAEDVAELLLDSGLDAKHYHAGLKAEEREATQDWFVSKDAAIIVATIAFGMGIDKSNIRHVYHYNLPKSIENYSQEIGRAGRDGATSICECLLVAEDVRVLENFVFGDTPDVSSVHSLIADLFSRGPEFDVSLYDLSAKHDIRDLVIETLLTYLQLDGLLQSATPYYAEYKFKPRMPSGAILNEFDDARKEFLTTIFRQAKQGRIWFTLDLETCVAATKSDRHRVVNAMEYLAEKNMVELKMSGVRHPFRVLQSPDIADVANNLYERMLARENRDLNRIEHLVDLMTFDGCQTSALGGYFGEPLPQPCGHCSWCETERPTHFEARSEFQREEATWEALEAVLAQYPDVFSSPRAVARFACGIRSPLLTKSKLTRHELFGCLANAPFSRVLAEAQATPSA